MGYDDRREILERLEALERRLGSRHDDRRARRGRSPRRPRIDDASRSSTITIAVAIGAATTSTRSASSTRSFASSPSTSSTSSRINRPDRNHARRRRRREAHRRSDRRPGLRARPGDRRHGARSPPRPSGDAPPSGEARRTAQQRLRSAPARAIDDHARCEANRTTMHAGESARAARLPHRARRRGCSRRASRGRAGHRQKRALFRFGEQCNNHCPMCSNTGEAALFFHSTDELLAPRRLPARAAASAAWSSPAAKPPFTPASGPSSSAWRRTAWCGTSTRMAAPSPTPRFARRAVDTGLERAIVSLHSHDAADQRGHLRRQRRPRTTRPWRGSIVCSRRASA